MLLTSLALLLVINYFYYLQIHLQFLNTETCTAKLKKNHSSEIQNLFLFKCENMRCTGLMKVFLQQTQKEWPDCEEDWQLTQVLTRKYLATQLIDWMANFQIAK